MEKKKIILISPHSNSSQQITPPLGLGYLAGSLLSAGHEAEIIDCFRDGITNEQMGGILLETKPDLIGITVVTSAYPCVVELCKTLRNCHNYGAKIILGGSHPTALPESTLRDTGADAVILGEGEKTITELAVSEDWRKVDGIAYLDKKSGKFVKTKPREIETDIDKLAWPAWHLMAPDKYPKAPHGIIVRNFPVAPIITSRGCPYNCSFCAVNNIWQHKFRRRSPKNVVDEMEYLVKTFGVKEIHIEDDNFTLVRGHAEKISQEILDRKLNISWKCPNGVRADRLDLDLLKLMKKSGCYLLAFGIESGSDEILKRHSKAIDKEKIREAVRMCKEVGIETQGFFILGLPGETKETIDKTIQFSKELELDWAYFSIFTPFPGSRLWSELKDKTKDLDWSLLKQSTVARSFCVLSDDELEVQQKRAFRQFYLRPKMFLNLAKYVRPAQLIFLLERAKKQFF